MIIGLVVFSTPFLGIPYTWKSVLLCTCGAVLVFIALLYRTERRGTVAAGAVMHAERDPERFRETA